MDELLELEHLISGESVEERTPKKPRLGTEAGSSGSPGSFGSPSVGGSVAKPPCSGCWRVVDEPNADFLEVGSPAAWALPNGKGLWCRDCFNVWRTLYQGTIPLGILGVWLQAPEHKDEFSVALAAYLTLKREGAEKITVAILSARADALRFSTRLLCAPWRASVLVPLRDLHTVLRGTWHPSPSDLVTIRSSVGDSVAVWVPIGWTTAPATKGVVVNRPIGETGPSLRDRPLIGTSQDIATLDKVLPELAGQSSLCTDMVAASGGSWPSVSHTPPANKLSAKTEIALSQCKSALSQFDDEVGLA